MITLTLDIAKKHCKIDDDESELLQVYFDAAISYAEEFQRKNYTDDEKEKNEMSKITIQAILLLISHYYDNREASDNTNSKTSKTMIAVNNLLYLGKNVKIC